MPDGSSDEPAPSLGWCPAWIPGPGTAPVSAAVMNGTSSTQLIPPGANPEVRNGTGWTFKGHPFDAVRLSVQRVKGTLEMRASMADNGTVPPVLRDYRHPGGTQLVPYVRLQEGDSAEVDVVLGGLLHRDGARPGPLILEWRSPGNASVEATATFLYRICGV